MASQNKKKPTSFPKDFLVQGSTTRKRLGNIPKTKQETLGKRLLGKSVSQGFPKHFLGQDLGNARWMEEMLRQRLGNVAKTLGKRRPGNA